MIFDGAPELEAILRTGHRSRFRLSQHICGADNERFAEVFRSPAGPILLGRGLEPTAEGDRQRRGWVVRYLDREPPGAAVSLQCRCQNHVLGVDVLLKQEGRVVYPVRKPTVLR